MRLKVIANTGAQKATGIKAMLHVVATTPTATQKDIQNMQSAGRLPISLRLCNMLWYNGSSNKKTTDNAMMTDRFNIISFYCKYTFYLS
jgi:hypothetical protein